MQETKLIEYYEGFNLQELHCDSDPYIVLIHHNDVDGIVSKFNIQRKFNINISIPAAYNKKIEFDTIKFESVITTRPKIAFVVDFCLKE